MGAGATEIFWVSTKVAGTDRENTRRFSAFLVEKWTQEKNESGDRTDGEQLLLHSEFYQVNQGRVKS